MIPSKEFNSLLVSIAEFCFPQTTQEGDVFLKSSLGQAVIFPMSLGQSCKPGFTKTMSKTNKNAGGNSTKTKVG